MNPGGSSSRKTTPHSSKKAWCVPAPQFHCFGYMQLKQLHADIYFCRKQVINSDLEVPIFNWFAKIFLDTRKFYSKSLKH